MPDTARWVIDSSGYKQYSVDQLTEPNANMDIGTWYLGALFKEFHSILIGRSVTSQYSIIAAAYNAGPGNVMRWLNEGKWDGENANLKQIPYGETRLYVQRVLNFYAKYARYYEEF